ncbi:DMSO reductase maturation protein DsmD [Actinobacillus succinogenes]|uniref:Probable Tat proofreading chaperone DmsD n=1 Tax=Actinobacillus succinogenes (strain ATCC 55618 / DSM 22257 / CCUG 43843 / 130Z) TaxID=339671 RepID=A6VPI1_ACTSZ|nr:Tat proofreading chaperone DmsD [Actinobacillus succinogenes]ABR74878.1 cytoplasmic chaperone TorD family protein [Actinobacillus succinogenes 130Z]PHI40712.1 DMSO reductase maturation protein DsmD [Actinobacillus succinogenes]
MDNALLQWISIGGRLLGAVFYYAPQDKRIQPVLDFFRQPDWLNDWAALENPEFIHALIEKGMQQDLSQAYQYLFIGPNDLPAPPWGSVYLDKESVIFGDSLLALREFLAVRHIEFIKTQNEPEDHLGLMFMLAAYLAETKPEYLSEFLSEHFVTWAYRCLDLIAEQTDYPFYQGMALLARQTLEGWQQQLKLQPNRPQLYR